jgi:hypothetical protein
MLGNRRLVLDNFSEVFNLLKDQADEFFYDFGMVTPVTGSVYVIGRQQMIDHPAKIRSMAESQQYTMIFGNTAEGAWTLETQLQQLRVDDLALAKKLLILSGADMPDQYPSLTHEHFLPRILDYDENLAAQKRTEDIFSHTNKPYKFLFLNGRARPHRKYLYEKLQRTGALDQALWTMLDAMPCVWRTYTFVEGDLDVMATPSPLKHLPPEYEVDRYRTPVFGPIVPDRSFLKQELFNREWGEIYLEPAPYVDTYFSLVTETICAESPYSFRTEKIAKPLAMGHPFIAVSNKGFYQDLHNMGFQTFGHVIDESFDQIDNAQQRLDRIVDVVTDLCSQDLASFLEECYNTCKYNQQRLAEVRDQVRQEFPDRFAQFVSQYQ